MTKLEAVEYLVKNDKYIDEWSGAGMWEAVQTLMGNDMEWDKEHLDELLVKAENR